MSKTYETNSFQNETCLTFRTSNDDEYLKETNIEVKNINEDSNNKDNNEEDHDNGEFKDEIGKFYRRVKITEKFAEFIFYLNLVISAISVFEFKYQNLFFKINILSSITYVVATNLNDMIFKNKAENERRKGFITNSYKVNITRRTIEGYYNNEEKESVRKMGVNCFENVFFTKFIINKMLVTEGIKVFIIILLYIILLIEVKELELLVLITQTIFSSEYFFKFLKFIYFKIHVARIYEKLYEIFITSKKQDKNVIIVKILDATMDYECLKFYCQISLSTRIYNKYDDKLSKEWDELYHNKVEMNDNFK